MASYSSICIHKRESSRKKQKQFNVGGIFCLFQWQAWELFIASILCCLKHIPLTEVWSDWRSFWRTRNCLGHGCIELTKKFCDWSVAKEKYFCKKRLKLQKIDNSLKVQNEKVKNCWNFQIRPLFRKNLESTNLGDKFVIVYKYYHVPQFSSNYVIKKVKKSQYPWFLFF